MAPVIKVQNLQKKYRIQRKKAGFLGSLQSVFAREYENVLAVKNISFTISPGEVVGFIGPNGAGKTTTLKCLSGLLYPDQGSVEVLGFTPFVREKEFLKKISLVMGQKNQLWWDLPALDTFLLNKEIYGVPKDLFEKIVADLSAILEVEKFLNVPVRKLSLGQRMKMELIASLIHSPQVLFLDEPTIGLDIVMQKKIREFLHEYNQKSKATILLTSHYMKDVEELCKRVIVINFGEIVFDGLLSDLVKKYASYKRVKIILAKEINRRIIDKFGFQESYNYPEWILHVDRSELKTKTSLLLKEFPIEDMLIEDPAIEDVIQQVFKVKKNQHV